LLARRHAGTRDIAPERKQAQPRVHAPRAPAVAILNVLVTPGPSGSSAAEGHFLRAIGRQRQFAKRN